MNRSAVYNTDSTIWVAAAELYRARPDGGPTIRALEGNLWGIPKLGWVARPAGCGFPFHPGGERVQGVTTGWALGRSTAPRL